MTTNEDSALSMAEILDATDWFIDGQVGINLQDVTGFFRYSQAQGLEVQYGPHAVLIEDRETAERFISAFTKWKITAMTQINED